MTLLKKDSTGFEVKKMVEIENFINTIVENSNYTYDEIETFLSEICKYPESRPVFFWNEPEYFDDGYKHPIMILIYSLMKRQNINGLYVTESI